MDPVTALIILGGFSALGKGYAQYQAMNEQEEALKVKSEQNNIIYQQKTLANYDLTNKILDAQLAQESARGVGLGSPSFQAIQENTLNVGAKNQRNLETEKSIFERNEDIEKQNVKLTFASQIFGDITDFASSLASVGSKLPSKA